MRRLCSLWLPFLCLLLSLAGCASGPRYTVDDGRPVNTALLANIKALGAGERLLRPAIEQSAKLRDRECDKQWELPFVLASSDGWSADDRVAWVRALGVDERLTVIAATESSPLRLGERISAVAGRSLDDAQGLLEVLAGARDEGRPFELATVGGRRVQVQPFEVCRGYARLAPPNTPQLQDYHWLLTMHPLELLGGDLSADEALWVVLWGQGLSEEGGARMKTYDYGMRVAGTLYNLVTLATGIRGAALAADAAMKAAQSAAANVASEVLKQQLIEQGKALALARLREGVTDTVLGIGKSQAVNALQLAAANRGSLSGVSRIAATVFERADAWAFARMQTLGRDPLAGLRLHQKLLERQLTSNSMILDAERLAELSRLAGARGWGDEVATILKGLRAEDLRLAVAAMPLASAPPRFSYESELDPTHKAFSHGLVDALLEMPSASATTKPR